MIECKYERKGKNITTLETGVTDTHKTINAAKRESRRLQMAIDNGLGRGVLRLG